MLVELIIKSIEALRVSQFIDCILVDGAGMGGGPLQWSCLHYIIGLGPWRIVVVHAVFILYVQ